ncbi:hypothetical protein PoB_004693700 [Plakobranchus ocellatus]|uniref:Uncharacterized protein n=1 Tax=Plakobranchus ocellatus TaxID=259542 RepID=A0AAV4BNB5_9GAST|nr:hypothetical protein PoB_004693700 [Plakobranchus ocellatus]
MPRLRDVILLSNPWICDRSLKLIYDAWTKRGNKGLDLWSCQNPQNTSQTLVVANIRNATLEIEVEHSIHVLPTTPRIVPVTGKHSLSKTTHNVLPTAPRIVPVTGKHSQSTPAHNIGFCIKPVYYKVISGFQALRQVRALVVGLQPDRRVPADYRAKLLATVPPTPPSRRCQTSELQCESLEPHLELVTLSHLWSSLAYARELLVSSAGPLPIKAQSRKRKTLEKNVREDILSRQPYLLFLQTM